MKGNQSDKLDQAVTPYTAPQASHRALACAKSTHPIAPIHRRTDKARTEAATALTDMPQTMMHREAVC